MNRFRITLFVIIMMALFPIANAENAYVDGTVWDVQTCGIIFPIISYGSATYKLDGVREIGGYEAMQLYQLYPDYDPKFIAFVRTEDDKVYFTNNEENPEWYLCFDFGMKPGDERICYNMFEKHPCPSNGMLMRCLAETTNTKYGDYPALEMVQVPKSGTYQNSTEIWLKGLGSESGPEICSWAGVVGGGYTLLRVTIGDRVIFENPGSGIAEPKVEQTSNAVRSDHILDRRVDNPADGVFIRAEGSTASKMLVK